MMLADTMAIFFSVVGLLIALPALWLTLSALWPGARCSGSGRLPGQALEIFCHRSAGGGYSGSVGRYLQQIAGRRRRHSLHHGYFHRTLDGKLWTRCSGYTRRSPSAFAAGCGTPLAGYFAR